MLSSKQVVSSVLDSQSAYLTIHCFFYHIYYMNFERSSPVGSLLFSVLDQGLAVDRLGQGDKSEFNANSINLSS